MKRSDNRNSLEITIKFTDKAILLIVKLMGGLLGLGFSAKCLAGLLY